MTLSDQQKRHLRGLAHDLKPVVWIGQHGLNENVLKELELALDVHELVKVKIVAERDERKILTQTICDKCDAELVQSIGQMAIIFRRNIEKPKVALPSK